MPSQLSNITDGKGFRDNFAHDPMGGNSVMQCVAEAVALAPASHAIFDKSIFETDFACAIHKDTRAAVRHTFPPRQVAQSAFTLAESNPLRVNTCLPLGALL